VKVSKKMAEQKRKWYDLDPTVLAIIAAIAIVLASICLWRGFNVYCKDGKLVVNTVEHTTKINGIPFVVKDAKIAQCDSCGREVFSAKERNDGKQSCGND